ncbi:DUF4123 domain-containing protein [Serratia sp. DD3]|uniref:DUF4123 domain-containing protein n=1 Tax=Serratia sp. DD3 TaxID=1410619 RepID=UPI0003C51A03|nr:DUF4123 domain-containing protein [Serratia sp. DD3]KEY59311.1 hypothetical protein SRDD_15910 [Serratia sp. DD3]
MTTIEHTDTRVQFDYSANAIAQQTQAIVAQLTEQLTGSKENLLLLIDPVKLELDSSSPWISALTERQPEPVPLTHVSIPQAYYPWLVPLNITQPEDAQLFEESITQALQEADPSKLVAGAGRTVCAWLTSAQPAHIVARQLGCTAVQALSGGGNILLRYFDPAVNTLLWPQLSPFQQQRLMGVISGWHLIDGDGQLVSRRHSASPLPLLTFSLGMAEKDKPELEQIAVVNQALQQYRAQAKTVSRTGESQLQAVVKQALQRIAASTVIAEPEERILFAFHILRWHPYIDLHPEFNYLMSLETHPAQVRYIERIAGLTEQDWRRFADECDRLSLPVTHPSKELLP